MNNKLNYTDILDRQFLKEDARKDRGTAYICSPLSGTPKEIVANMQAARYYMVYIHEKMGYLVRAPHAFLPMILNDSDQEERALALEFGLKVLRKSQCVMVCGNRISDGMKAELEKAAKQHMIVYVYCKELYKEVRSILEAVGGNPFLVLYDEDHPSLASPFAEDMNIE